MVEHIVLFKFHETASTEAINAGLDALRALKNEIPGILELTCGENFTNRSQGFTHALYVRFVDKEALAAYGPHPKHVAVGTDHFNAIRADILAVDYEF